MRRRPVHGVQESLFSQMRLVPTAGYPRRVTDSMLRLLGPPRALSFDEAWDETMRDLPAPIGWRGCQAPGETSPVAFLRARLLLAWEDDEAVPFSREDLASIVEHSARARAAVIA